MIHRVFGRQREARFGNDGCYEAQFAVVFDG
jgi:hypothetical protein